MSVVVFCGPTLDADAARELLPGAQFRGPAECGDLYRVARAGITAVGLIDGYFDHRLSVWHKEILWALSQGVAVYGAASMGALRAAELHTFGMVGVGTVFEWFRDGVLESDDEVAVVHESQERGYRQHSIALVNLRRTLNEATSAAVLDAGTSEALLRELQNLHYPRRDRPALLQCLKQLSPARTEAFTRWLEHRGIVDQKRDDAVAMLQRMHADQKRSQPVPEKTAAGFRFHHTNAWQALIETVEAKAAPASEPTVQPLPVPASTEAAIEQEATHWLKKLDALAHKDAALHAKVIRNTLERALALTLAEQAQASLDAPRVQVASEQFRRERDLMTPEQTADWLLKNHLDVSDFSLLVHDSVLAEDFLPAARAAFIRQLPATLRLLDLYESIAALE